MYLRAVFSMCVHIHTHTYTAPRVSGGHTRVRKRRGLCLYCTSLWTAVCVCLYRLAQCLYVARAYTLDYPCRTLDAHTRGAKSPRARTRVRHPQVHTALARLPVILRYRVLNQHRARVRACAAAECIVCISACARAAACAKCSSISRARHTHTYAL